MMSFRSAAILFGIGAVGIGLAMSGLLPGIWVLIFGGVGLAAWLVFMLWGYLDYTLRAIRHVKQSWAIEKQMRAEKALERSQTVRKGRSDAHMRAMKRRARLWSNTIFGDKD